MAIAKEITKNLRLARRTHSEEKFLEHFQEGIEQGQISGDDVSIRDVFEESVDDGRELVIDWERNKENRVSLIENAVNTTMFSNITGQLMVNEVMKVYDSPVWISDALVTTFTTRLPKGEKIPGMAEIGNEAEAIGEGKPYPLVGFGEDWIETPETIKRGMICPLTREVIVQNNGSMLFDRARGVSKWIRYNKEIRVLQTVLGITSTYNRRSKGVVATYDDNAGNHDWDNLAATNALADYTDVEAALLLWDAMVDPNTGTPIMMTPGSLTAIVPSALAFVASRVFRAPVVGYGDGASNTTNYPNYPNPVLGLANVVTSPLVKHVTSSASTWFIGDFKGAFRYAEVSPIETVEAPVNSELEFTHDIMKRWKVSEWGAPFAYEPRLVIKNTA